MEYVAWSMGLRLSWPLVETNAVCIRFVICLCKPMFLSRFVLMNTKSKKCLACYMSETDEYNHQLGMLKVKTAFTLLSNSGLTTMKYNISLPLKK